MIKNVIFDLDGTLLNTLEDLRDSANAALEAFGYPPRTTDEVRRFVGNGVRLLMIRATPGGEQNEKFEEILAYFRRHYAEHCFDQTRPYDGILPMLDRLKTAGIGLAVVSNKFDAAVRELCRRYFPDQIAIAIGEREGIRKKPAPDSVLQAMRELHADPSESLYVGDSDVDIETARNAGIPCVSVTWGFRDRDFLLAHGASVLIDDPSELLP